MSRISRASSRRRTLPADLTHRQIAERPIAGRGRTMRVARRAGAGEVRHGPQARTTTPQVADVGERDDRAPRPTRRRALVLDGADRRGRGRSSRPGSRLAVGGRRRRRTRSSSDRDDARGARRARRDDGVRRVRDPLRDRVDRHGGRARRPVDGHGTHQRATRTALATGRRRVATSARSSCAPTASSIWEHGGARLRLAARRDRGCRPAARRASPASSRARSGRGPGAVSMLNLASPTGYLALSVDRR